MFMSVLANLWLHYRIRSTAISPLIERTMCVEILIEVALFYRDGDKIAPPDHDELRPEL